MTKVTEPCGTSVRSKLHCTEENQENLSDFCNRNIQLQIEMSKKDIRPVLKKHEFKK